MLSNILAMFDLSINSTTKNDSVRVFNICCCLFRITNKRLVVHSTKLSIQSESSNNNNNNKFRFSVINCYIYSIKSFDHFRMLHEFTTNKVNKIIDMMENKEPHHRNENRMRKRK